MSVNTRRSRAPRALPGWALALAAVVSLALGACGPESASTLQVLGNTIPDDACTVKAQGGGGQQAFRPSGVLDLSLGDAYYSYLMVTNQFPQFESATGYQPESLRVEPGDVTVTGVQVALNADWENLVSIPAQVDTAYGVELQEHFGDLGLSGEFQQVFGGGPLYVQRMVSTNIAVGGTGVVIADVIPPHIGRALRGLQNLVDTDGTGADVVELIAQINIVGIRQDGKPVRSGTFFYPIKLCNGCLVADIYPPAIAQNPFNPPAGEPLSIEDALGTVSDGIVPCAVGADDAVTNAFCGAVWATGTCQQARCLGTPPGDNLVCPSDGTYFPPSGLDAGFEFQ